MKKLYLLIVACVTVLLLSACVSEKNVHEDYTESSVNFDLSQYKYHGELSEGLIWVVDEVSDWDTDPYEIYAYLDCDGNVVYGWHAVGTFYNYGFYDCPATSLQDFKNGYALIYDNGPISKGGFADAVLIDKNGIEFASMLISADIDNRGAKLDYLDFNSQGYAFFIGREDFDENVGMYFINDSGVHKFQCNENSYIARYTLDNIDLINNKYLYVKWCNYQLFDLHGNMVMDLGELTGLQPDYIDIVYDTYIEAHFTGKDEKSYVCVIDFNGNFINSPVLKSQYVRNIEEWEQAATDSITGIWVCETPDFRTDTLNISENTLSWRTEWNNGASEESIMYYNDTEFYESSYRVPYKSENGAIIATLADGSEITFVRKS